MEQSWAPTLTLSREYGVFAYLETVVFSNTFTIPSHFSQGASL